MRGRGTSRRRATIVGTRNYISLFRFVALLPIVAGCFYVLLLMPPVPSIAVLTATVESMTYRVVIPEMARVSLRGYALSFEAPVTDLGFGGDRTVKSQTTTKALCLEGLVTPAPGTLITYERFSDDPIAVELRRDDGKPVGVLDITKGVLPDAARKASWLRLVAKDDDDDSKSPLTCSGTPMTRLPIYGIADIGSEIRPLLAGEKASSGTLLDGTLDIFARTIDFRALNKEPRIYPATSSSITIPPGSKITVSDPDERQKPWVGFAMPDAANGVGLDVRLTTEANNISIVRPGVGLTPEVISVGLFTQLVNDPTLIAAQVVIALLFAIFEMLGSATSWFRSVRPSVIAPSPGNANAVADMHTDATRAKSPGNHPVL